MADAMVLGRRQPSGAARSVVAAAAETAVEGRDLVKTFAGGAVRALDGVSVAIRSNEFFTLLGPSGCGKTTLLRIVAGFETQDAGSVFVHGQALDGLPPFRRPVNTVFQSYAVFPHMTVEQNIALLLDEPLSALDLKLRTGMQLELKRLQAEIGITFVFVTHDQHEALTMSDRIAVMNGGKILQIGTPEEIYERPSARFVADFIGETNLLEATRIGERRFRLASGAEIEAAEPGPVGKAVTLAVRPERANLAPPGGAGLAGIVEQVVYEGTDTTYYVLLAGGLRFRLREQNREGARPRVGTGDAIAVTLPAAAIRVLVE